MRRIECVTVHGRKPSDKLFIRTFTTMISIKMLAVHFLRAYTVIVLSLLLQEQCKSHCHRRHKNN